MRPTRFTLAAAVLALAAAAPLAIEDRPPEGPTVTALAAVDTQVPATVAINRSDLDLRQLVLDTAAVLDTQRGTWRHSGLFVDTFAAHPARQIAALERRHGLGEHRLRIRLTLGEYRWPARSTWHLERSEVHVT